MENVDIHLDTEYLGFEHLWEILQTCWLLVLRRTHLKAVLDTIQMPTLHCTVTITYLSTFLHYLGLTSLALHFFRSK